MKCPLPFSQNTELRMLSVLLACTSVGIAGWLFCARDIADSLGEHVEPILATMLFASGVMQGVGTFGKRRKLRQVGLVLSALGLLSIGSLLVGTLFGIAVLLLIMAVVHVYPLLKDVMGKPRVQ